MAGVGLAPDHADRPGGPRRLEPGDGDRRAADLDGHRHFRDQGDADAGADHLHERRERTALHQGPRRQGREVADLQRLLAEAVPLLQQQQPHLAQHRRARYRPRRLVARADKDELFLEERGLGQRGFGSRQRDDRRIEPAADEILDQEAGQGLARAQLDIRVAPDERLDEAGQEIGRDRGDDPDAQAPGQGPARGAGEIGEFVDRAQNVATAQRELLAQRRQPDLLGAALDEGDAEAVLEILDLQGEGRLRDRAMLGGAAEMALAGEGVEIAQVPDGQGRHRFFSSLQL